MELNEGIEIAIYKSNEVGLSYSKQRDLLAGMGAVTEGYLFDDQNYAVSRLPDSNHKYFLSLAGIVARKTVGTISVVPAADLIPQVPQALSSFTLSSREPLPAQIPGSGFGFLYPNENCLQRHFPNALWLTLHANYEVPDFGKGEVAFISLQALQRSSKSDKNWDPVQFVAISAVKVVCGASAAQQMIPVDAQALVRSQSKVSFRAASSAPAPAVLASQRTPAPVLAAAGSNKDRPKGSRSATSDSTGATTVADNDSSFFSRTGSARSSAMSTITAPDTANSPPSTAGRSSRSSSSLGPSPAVSQPVQVVAKASPVRKGDAQVAAKSKGTSSEQARCRLPGPSDVDAEYDLLLMGRNRGRSSGVQLEREREASQRFNSGLWPNMRAAGWSCIWLKNPLRDTVEAYAVPLVRQFSSDLIENLSYFHSKEALCAHVDANPCLSEGGQDVIARLVEAGWVKVLRKSTDAAGNAATSSVCYSLGFAEDYRAAHPSASSAEPRPSPKNKDRTKICSTLDKELSKGLIPGIHLFVSIESLLQYAARFPYLLKPPEMLVQWLSSLGWEVDTRDPTKLQVRWVYSKEDARVTAKWRFRPPAASASASYREWLPVKEVVRRLWLCPQRAFLHAPGVPASIPLDHILNCIRLPEQYALTKLSSLPTPEASSWTAEDRETQIRTLKADLASLLALSRKQGSDDRTGAVAKQLHRLEQSAGAVLLALQWKLSECDWSQDWWKSETAWVAPWTAQLVSTGKKPMLGRDFFWSLQKVAEYAVQSAQATAPFVELPSSFRPDRKATELEERVRTDHQLKFIARNSKGNPFAQWPVADMLKSTGWEYFEDRAGQVLFIPYWKTDAFSAKNYQKGVLGTDYFDVALVVDHLEEFGNEPGTQVAPAAAVPKPPAQRQQQQRSEPSAAAAAVSPPQDQVQASEPASGSSTGSAERFIVYHGERYPTFGAEARVRGLLEEENPSFGVIFSNLKKIGWGSAWCGQLNTYLILPPWSYEVKDAFVEGSFKRVKNHSVLKRSVDYFEDSDEGKRALIQYLTLRGFVRRLRNYNPFERLAEEEEEEVRPVRNGTRVRGVVVRPFFSKEGVEHYGVSYSADSPQYRLLCLLFDKDKKRKDPHFGQVYTILKEQFLWGNHYVQQLGCTLICASWSLDVPGAFTVEGSARYRLVDHTVLKENVDYFLDTDEGKQEMIQFLKWNGLEAPLPVDPAPEAEAEAQSSRSAAALKAKKTDAVDVPVVQSRKRKAASPAAKEEEQEVQCRAVTVTTLPALALELSANASAGASAAADANGARRSRRGAPLNPATEKDMMFSEDWQPVKRLIQSHKLQLTEEHVAEQLWMALNSHNKSWRCVDDLQGNPLFVRSEGCNAYYVGNFAEGVDYFRSLPAALTFIRQQVALLGESALLEVKKSSPVDSVTMQGMQGLTIHKRSPNKACYRASDPESQFDRLVGAPSPVYSPSAYRSRDGESESDDEDNNYFTSSSYKAHGRAAYDVDMQEAFDVLASPARSPSASQPENSGDASIMETDTQFLPLTQQLSKHEGPSLMDLLTAPAPNFERIFQCLPVGWTFAFVSHGAVMPSGDRAYNNRVFLRPGCSLQNGSDLVKNEDYFLSEDSLIDYLRVQCGLQTMPQDVSNSKKPRITRRGTVIDVSHAPGTQQGTSSSGLSTVGSPLVPSAGASSPAAAAKKAHKSAGADNAVGDKRVRDVPKEAGEGVLLKRPRSSSIQSVASVSSQQAAGTPPLPAMSLQERIQSVRQALVNANKQSAYSGHWDGSRIPLAEVSRKDEFLTLKAAVVKSLTRAQGAALYLCGCPGMGKTLTVVDCLDGVAQDRRDVLSAESNSASPSSRALKSGLGYQVLWLNGASLTQKQAAYTAIAAGLGLNPPAGGAAQMLAERFGSAGQSIELSQASVLSDIEDSGTDEDAEGPPSSQGTSSSRVRRTSSYSSTASGSHKRRRIVPMTVLVIDELDLVSRDVREHLLQLSTAPTSSLVLIGMGNFVTLDLQAAVKRVVFRPYEDTQLVQIVKRLTGDLFSIMARSMLAKKVVGANKGDVRALLRLAELCLDRAAKELPNTDGPSREIVDVKHVSAACNANVKNETVEIIESLPISTRFLLVALFKHAADYPEGFYPRNIVRAFNDYLEMKHLPTETHHNAMKHMEQLTNYSLASVIKKSHDPEKRMYKVQVDFDLLLKAQYGEADCTAAVRAELRQIKNNLSRRETEASLTQY